MQNDSSNNATIRLITKSVKRFGTVNGLKLAASLLLGRGEFDVALPTYQHPLSIRQGTSDIEVFEKVLIGEEYLTHVDDPCVIVDLGANVGFASVFFANRHPGSLVVAVEPEPSNFKQLQRNIAGYDNIIAVEKAIWPTEEPVRIGNAGDEKWSFRMEAATAVAEPEAIETITMPQILALCNGRPIDILKVDIESAEKQLFGSPNTEWLDDVNLLIIELHDNLQMGSSKSFYDAVGRYDFNQYILGENIVVSLK